MDLCGGPNSLHPPSSFISVLNIMRDVDNQVRSDIFDCRNLKKNHRIQLSHEQLMKHFERLLVPSDPENYCPYCKL